MGWRAPKQAQHEPVELETVTRRMWRTKVAESRFPDSLSAEALHALPIASETPAQPSSQLPAQPSATEATAATASVAPDSQSAQEQHRQAAKQAQKDRFNRSLAEVDQSISDGDHHVALKTLKLLRPWQPARRAQLKSNSGHILSPTEEPDTLSKYAKDIFAAHLPLAPHAGTIATP